MVIVARGGGSIEDLWAFNELRTAKAIYDCEVPVISAVGHETDFTIADFVADKRAATPSEAAELAVPVDSDVIAKLLDLRERLSKGPRENLRLKKEELKRLSQASCFSKQGEKIENMRFYLKTKEDKMKSAAKLLTSLKTEKVVSLRGKLEALNPMAVLERGYCAVKTADGRVAESAKQFAAGDELSVIFADGEAKTTVREVNLKK